MNDSTLHYNELYSINTHIRFNREFLTKGYHLLQFTTDLNLKAFIVKWIQYVKEENSLLMELIKDKGITHLIGHTEIPYEQTMKINDFDISAILSMNIATGLVTSSQALELSRSKETTIMYKQFHMKKAILGAKLLQLRKDKGWFPILIET